MSSLSTEPYQKCQICFTLRVSDFSSAPVEYNYMFKGYDKFLLGRKKNEEESDLQRQSVEFLSL